MMKLYYKPGACSLASRIVLGEMDTEFEAIKVDTKAGKTESGADYKAINPRGYVPALQLADGTVIAENIAILYFLAEQAPQKHLLAGPGSFDRIRALEWLSFTSSELHKAFGPFFSGGINDATRQSAQDKLARRIGDVEQALSVGQHFIVGNHFTVADAYLFVVLSWTKFIHFDLTAFPKTHAYFTHIAQRPAVVKALKAEGF